MRPSVGRILTWRLVALLVAVMVIAGCGDTEPVFKGIATDGQGARPVPSGTGNREGGSHVEK